MSPRLPFVPRPGQIMDPKMLQMASVYSIQPLSGLQGVSTLRMDAPSSTTRYAKFPYVIRFCILIFLELLNRNIKP